MSPANATVATYTWLGPTNVSWNFASNWSPSTTYPNNGNAGISDFDVIIPAVLPPNWVPETQPGITTIDTLSLPSPSSELEVGGESTLAVNGPSIVNNGNISLSSSFTPTLDINGGTLSGSGSIYLLGGVLGGSFTQASGHTIDGQGTITAAMTNNGTIDGTYEIGLEITSSTMTNNSVLEATDFGEVDLRGVSLSQGSTGQLDAAGGTVGLTNTSISGGTITSSGAGAVVAGVSSSHGTVTLGNTTNNALFDVAGDCNVNVTANLVNNGQILLNSDAATVSGGSCTISFGGVTLSGTGTLSMIGGGGTNSVLTGSLTQSSGHTIDGGGIIAAALTNNGTVNADLDDGELILQTFNETNNGLMEQTASGAFIINSITINQGAAGTIRATNFQSLQLNGATISGGSLTSTSGGVFAIYQTCTLANVTDNAPLVVEGPFNMQGASTLVVTGVVTSNSIITNDGTITGDVNNSSTLKVNGTLAGTGQLIVPTSGAVLFAVNAGGSTEGALSISGTGRVDLANNHLFIDYGSNPDPIASIISYLKSGYNGGAWNGSGIDSSVAAANSASYGLGYADSADAGNPAGLSSGQIEIKYTLLGDVNLDGTVNAVDFGILAANFNKTVSRWDQGDFNYDNAVNGVDFGYLAENFNKGASGAAGGSALSNPALVAFAESNGLIADLPEPAAFGLLAVTAAGFVLRRRRSL